MGMVAVGHRMRQQHEAATALFLPRHTFTVVRVDGRAFHTYTRNLERPFDQRFHEDMVQEAQALTALCTLTFSRTRSVSC